MRSVIVVFYFLFINFIVKAQPLEIQNPNTDVSFLVTQKNFPRVNLAYTNKLDTIIKQFAAKNIKWPIQQIYIRSFKVDNLIEIWVKDSVNTAFKFYKQMKVCASAGKLGPKRKEGDKQVPEGFYLIERFNPNSNYHLSLGVSYPNVSDKILADSVRPGGDIYVHGDCVSVGCLAINNDQIEELYVLAVEARNQGQEFQPIHIFPGKFGANKARDSIAKLANDNPNYTGFLAAMRKVYYYFEKEREIPAILVNNKGQYVIDDVELNAKNGTVLKIVAHPVRKYKENEVMDMADTIPMHPQGMMQYFTFLQNLTNELKSALNDNETKALIQLEFIVNTDGKVSNVIIKKGGNEQIDEIIKNRFESIENWKPAYKNGIAVPFRMKQNLFVEQDKVKMP
jgi:murein L,D-transpeptidase YafK